MVDTRVLVKFRVFQEIYIQFNCDADPKTWNKGFGVFLLVFIILYNDANFFFVLQHRYYVLT